MPPILFPMRNMPIQATQSGRQLASPRLIRGARPLPAVYLRIFGVTKDSTGAVLAACTVTLYRTSDDAVMSETTSDGVGYYEFSVGLSTAYYVIAYKLGSPDVAGTTVNTLIGS